MKQTYRKILAVILAASVVTVTGLLLTGCSEQKKDAEPTSATASETTAATEQQNNDASQVSTDGSAEQSDSDSESDSDGDTNESTASEATASTTSETTVSTEQQNSAESQVNNDSSLEQSDSDSESDSDGYIDEATAIANVRSLVGSGAEIISSEKGYTSEGWAAWVIVVAPVTTSDGPETVTYYSGYQFCYPETSYRDNDTDTNTDIDSDGYIDQATAIANVKQQVGSGAEIISSEKGYTPEGWAAWVIVVAPVTTSDGPETVTYYSGYQFCYPETSYRDNDTDTNTDIDSDGYIDQATAIANVKQQVGSGAEIISSEKGYTPEGWAAWVIVVAPVTASDNPETVTFYSGYQFCYRTDSAE